MNYSELCERIDRHIGMVPGFRRGLVESLSELQGMPEPQYRELTGACLALMAQYIERQRRTGAPAVAPWLNLRGFWSRVWER